ncbi:hypothetical protein LH464_21460 [Neorhizobium sp. T786]|uniref:hypothetical protein n=1 Tax=Pseudorhizobium xiangyangii TaxID=2883104 RepID=UPI001CFFE6B3|nr:hypothetical protein [Neorhizobium xiangyangii]MCB5205037.1 hypothetical protein [Neorhizobium xiangyangii]
MNELGWIALGLAALTVIAFISGSIAGQTSEGTAYDDLTDEEIEADLAEKLERELGTGTEAPVPNPKLRDLIIRDRYERECA